MAKQWQLRRGTTAQNDAFTGVVGEVTVDTTTNELRVHDGTTVGGHVVGNITRVTVDNSDLFDFKFTDHLLDNESWARADLFDWMYKSNYPEAYNHLKTEFDAIEKATYYYWASAGHEDRYCWTESRYPEIGDTIYYDIEQGLTGEVTGYDSANDTLSISYDGHNWSVPYVDEVHDGAEYDVVSGTTIEYYIAADGHKIALADQETNISSVYTSVNVAWYYILDTQNERFKLPRTKHAFVGYRDKVGKYVAPGLPNIKGEFTNTGWILTQNANATNGCIKTGATRSVHYGDPVGSGVATFDIDASRSSSIYSDSVTTVQPPANQMYLYFYLKPTNTQIDCHRVIETQMPTAENNYTWYRLYSDGWVEQGGLASTGEMAITFEVQMANVNYYPSLTAGRTSAWAGDYTPMYYNKTTTGMTIKFDSESTDNCWEVKGIAA